MNIANPPKVLPLASKYLPIYNFSERHDIEPIKSTSSAILSAVKSYDGQQDAILNALLKIREYPARLANKLGLVNALQKKPRFGLHEFTLLEETTSALAYGLIGRFWRHDFGLVSIVDSTDFQHFNNQNIPKLVMWFSIEPIAEGNYRLCTETRILCESKRSRILFMPYWVAIRVASGWIRKRMLEHIKKNAEQAVKVLSD
ncbi:hypothetical protein [Aquitalea sp.]|uniref:hypothetical protein n=1 Tax=Aquitalea sp. TaxID=1872623 RepID=UPI0025911EEB|nr:hypothetical protein [Aquitalea sp.]